MALTEQQQTDIYKMGVGLFQASPGTVYMNWFAGLLESGLTIDQLYETSAIDPTFIGQNFGFTNASTNEQFAAAFVDHVTGDTLSDENRDFAIDFIAGALDSGMTRGQVMKLAIDALDAVPHDDENFGAAAARFDNQVEVARDYTENLSGDALTLAELQGTIASVDETTESVEAAKEANAVAEGQQQVKSFVLTTDIDDITGTNGTDVFKGVINGDDSTYQTGDIANGSGGSDTFELTIADQTGVDPLVETTDIETFKIRDLWGSTIDGSLWAGVTRVESNKSLEDLDVEGLQNGVIMALTDSKDNDFDITYDDGALGTDEYEQFFEFTNVGDSNNTVDNHVDTNSATDLITKVNIKATGENFVEVGGGGAFGDIEQVTVTGEGALEVSNHGGSFDDATVVDLSANSGGVAIEVGHEELVLTGGSGDDEITLSNGTALVAGASIDLGAGDDSLLDNGSAGVGTETVLDGGDGDDAITSTLLEVGNQANIQNWEILDLAGESRTLDASLFTKSTFKSLALSDATAGNVTVTKLAGTAIVLDNTASTFDANIITATLATATGTADTGAINFDSGADSFLGGFTTAGLETFTIDSSGDDGVVNELGALRTTDNVLTKITITGANDFFLDGVTTNDPLSGATASADVASSLTSIDGSAATGDLEITAGEQVAIGATAFFTTYNSLSIKTGSGDDFVDIGGRGSVSTGTGADTVFVERLGVSVDVGVDDDVDVVELADTADFSPPTLPTTRMTTITNLASGDMIDFSSIENVEDTITDFTATALTFGSLEAAVDAALAVVGDEVNFIDWVDGNDYLVVDGVNDTIIKLVGDFTAGGLTLAAGVVTVE